MVDASSAGSVGRPDDSRYGTWRVKGPGPDSQAHHDGGKTDGAHTHKMLRALDDMLGVATDVSVAPSPGASPRETGSHGDPPGQADAPGARSEESNGGGSGSGEDGGSDLGPTPGEEPDEAAQDPVDRLGCPEVTVLDAVIDVASMAAYDWAEPPQEPFDIAARIEPSGVAGHWRARIEWPSRESEGVTVYRVIVADGQPADSDCDDVDMTLAVRAEPFAIDDTSENQPAATTRYYEVWAYYGDAPETAVAGAPFLYATGKVIWPPLMMEAFADNGLIITRWFDLGDAEYRWIRRTRKELRASLSPASGTPVAEAGFVDSDAEPGTPYQYAVFSGVQIQGSAEWSDKPATVRAELPVRLEAVMDLRVEPEAGRPDLVSISWTAPLAGDVEIYRSVTPPSPDLHLRGEVADGNLLAPELGLAEAVLVPNPTAVDASGRAHKRGVALPAGEAEFYFTPVTGTKRGTARMPGRPVVLLRPATPGNPFLEDRVDWTLIAFEWPRGATKVCLYVTAAGARIDPANARPLQTIMQEEWRAFGGFEVPRDRLPAGRRALHLVAHKQHGETQAYSEAATLEHEFGVIVRYSLDLRIGWRNRSKLTVTLWADHEVRALRTALMWHAQGLPLSLADGRVLVKRELSIGAGEPTIWELEHDLDLSGLPAGGYLRLLCDPRASVALLDPPAAELRLIGRGKS